jgi:hypothetical protein
MPLSREIGKGGVRAEASGCGLEFGVEGIEEAKFRLMSEP